MIRKALFIAFIFAAFLARGSAQSVRTIYCNASDVVTPGHAITINCYAAWGSYHHKSDTFRVELAPLTGDEAVDFTPDKPTPAEIARPKVNGASFVLGPLENATVMLSAPKPGAYAVRVYQNDTLAATELSTVSRFGIITMHAANGALYAPVDLTTDTVTHQRLDVTIRSNGRVERVPMASDGTYLVRHGATDAGSFEAVGDDGSIATFPLSGGYGWAPPEQRIFAQTDRPLYRPGDNVDIRAIVRTGSIGDYRIDRSPLVIDVSQESPTRLIARRALTPDAFGVVATSVKLPPDAQLGDYTVTIPANGENRPMRAIAGFDVEAYKKPEYTLDVSPKSPVTVGGNDVVFTTKFTYLSGASAANQTLHYTASTGYWGRAWYGPFDMYPSESDSGQSFSGKVVTDANGIAEIYVPTSHQNVAGDASISVDARDESGRTVTQTADATIVPGTFRLSIDPERWTAEAKVPATIAVRASNYDGSPRVNQNVHIAVIEERWHDDHFDEVNRGTLDLRTGSDGSAHFTYTPIEAGVYRYDVSGEDERGDSIVASQYQWAFDPNSDWAPSLTQPKLIPAKTQFAAGEPLEATLVVLHPARQAIVTVSTDRIVDHRVVPIHGLMGAIRVAPPRDAQWVSLTACVPDEIGVTCTSTVLSIAAATKLTVRLVSDKPQYRPGDRAHFRLHVTDDRGKPVRAELSLGVVDEGIYALAPPQGDTPDGRFYRISLRVWGSGNWYRPNANPTGTLKTIAKVTTLAPMQAADTYSVSASDQNGVPSGRASLERIGLRKNFLDTAYWSPNLTTNVHGNATATFTWPENLTTWRASTVAATIATQFGMQSVDVLVTKPLMARLEIPRFLRAGDSATITGIVHGPKAGMPVRMRLDPGFLASPEPPVTVRLDDAKRASAGWTVASGYVGSVDLALRAAGGDDTDGMQLTLPLLGATPLEHVRSSGSVSDSANVPIEVGPRELAGALHLSFEPSMIAQLAQTVREFDVYPYYCTEQTSSNGIVAAALMLAGASQKSLALPNDPRTVIAKARDRLMQLRHVDGAWGWWNSDATSVFMTSYALYAQDVMDRATHVTFDYDAGVAAVELGRLLQSEGRDQPDAEVALAAYALSRTKPGELPEGVMKRLVGKLRRTDVLTIALTGLAARTLGDDADAETAAQLLIQRGTTANGATFWHDLDWDWRWWSDPIEATALGALLLHETGHEPEAQRALTFIRGQRNGDWWYTTLDTAMASMAIAEIEGPQGAGDPDETASVLVDGRVVKAVRITSALPDADDTHVVVPASVMHGARVVSIERSGSGNLYWDSDFEKYGAANATEIHGAPNGVLAKLFAKPPALSVKREYSVGHPGPWRIGDVVNVTLWITAPGGAEYVTLEDPFPAGTEYQVPQGETGMQWRWDGAQFLDDRAAFFIHRLPAGETETITYSLRATTVGTFEAPGPSAFASYGPPVQTVGTGERVKIVGE